MVIALTVIAALGLALGAAWVIGSPRQQPDRAAEACWSSLAEQLDLSYDPGGLLKGPLITGQIDGMEVKIDTLHQLRDSRKLLMTRFILTNESLPEGLDRKSKAKPSDEPIKRILAQVTRRHVTELIKRIGATVAGKKVRWVRESAVWSPESTAETIRRICQICDFLCIDESDVATRLLHGYQDKALPDTHRDEMKRLLFESFPGSQECEAIAGDMLEDPDPTARLSAARALGSRGLDTLAKIARSSDIPKELREQAFGELLSKHEPSVIHSHLASVIKSPNPEVSRTALAMIRRHKYLPAIRLLLEITKDPATQSDKICNIVDIIGEIGDPSAQPTLLALLQHEFLMVRRRAASALGRVGTQSALGPLQQCASAAGANRRFKDLCLRAIARIKKRNRNPSDSPAAEAV